MRNIRKTTESAIFVVGLQGQKMTTTKSEKQMRLAREINNF